MMSASLSIYVREKLLHFFYRNVRGTLMCSPPAEGSSLRTRASNGAGIKNWLGELIPIQMKVTHSSTHVPRQKKKKTSRRQQPWGYIYAHYYVTSHHSSCSYVCQQFTCVNTQFPLPVSLALPACSNSEQPQAAGIGF